MNQKDNALSELSELFTPLTYNQYCPYCKVITPLKKFSKSLVLSNSTVEIADVPVLQCKSCENLLPDLLPEAQAHLNNKLNSNTKYIITTKGTLGRLFVKPR